MLEMNGPILNTRNVPVGSRRNGGEMSDIVLPRLLGTREAAEALVQTWRVGNDGASEASVIARAVALATPSFVNAFVTSLEKQGVQTVRLRGASKQFASDLTQESEKHAGRLNVLVAA